MQSTLEPHHAAWLALHRNRDAQWLKDMLKAGFDVHHIDGDHGNNEPSNLVLIEHLDHMRLHGSVMAQGRLGFVSRKGKRRPKQSVPLPEILPVEQPPSRKEIFSEPYEDTRKYADMWAAASKA